MDEKKLKKYFSLFLRKGDILYSEMIAIEEKIENLISSMKVEIANMNIRMDGIEKRIKSLEK